MTRLAVFDVECDGFNATKIHCLSVEEGKGLKSTSSYKAMSKYFTDAEVLIGHNIVRYDIPTVERILGVKVRAKLVDTLMLSWYLFPNRLLHGLEDWGEEFGVPKPKVDDWENLSTEEYIHRCEEDVKINTKLWKKCWSYLMSLYGSEEDAWRLIDYLTFKMVCAADQEKLRWKLDVGKAEKLLEKLTEQRKPKIDTLARAMPKVPVWTSKGRPAKPFKKDGSRSAHGVTWFNLLEEHNLPEDYTGEVKFISSYKEPNPNSSDQIKKWLYDLGWVPETFDYKRDKDTGEVRKIPQVRADYGEGKELCNSVKRLIDKDPNIAVLEGLTIINHRMTVVEGFLSAVDEEGYVKARIGGLTNTLRFKHRELVNLPGIDKPYGKDLRGCLTCPEGYTLIGSDMSSLEDRTKQHYMWDYDPDYVREMQTDDFDPHLDLCISGGLLTALQVADHKAGRASYSKERKKGKATNYACVYGAGGATVARSAGISEREGDGLVEAYWKRNWSVRAIAEDQLVKTVRGQKWLFNPVSKLWYSLRHEKDRFSTLNQGTGVWCFDTWVKHVKTSGLPIVGQFHDEVIGLLKENLKARASKVLQEAIDATNQELNLNRELGIDIQFGQNYSEIH